MIQLTHSTLASSIDAALHSRGIAHPSDFRDLHEGPYRIRFARDKSDLEAVQRLRFEVFNLELGEGLAASWTAGLDADEFDLCAHHLMIVDERCGDVVGTYRLQTAEMARAGSGFYCAREFDLAAIPEILDGGVELGRACVARAHRHGIALFALWRGIAAYLALQQKRYVFGCCSLTSRAPDEGEVLMRSLVAAGHVRMRVGVRPSFACAGSHGAVCTDVALPRLFAAYLRYGAQVLSGPAIDREFGTIDYFVALDTRALTPKLFKLFLTGLESVRGVRS